MAIEETFATISSKLTYDPQARGRTASLAMAIIYLITNTFITLIGLGAGIGVICTLGKSQQLNTHAMNWLSHGKVLIASPCMQILYAINPELKISENFNERNGFTSNIIHHFDLDKKAEKCYEANNFLTRHIISRLSYALLAIACLVTRAIDGCIGIIAAVTAILTAGHFESVNTTALQALQAPAIIADLFGCAVLCINPGAVFQNPDRQATPENAIPDDTKH